MIKKLAVIGMCVFPLFLVSLSPADAQRRAGLEGSPPQPSVEQNSATTPWSSRWVIAPAVLGTTYVDQRRTDDSTGRNVRARFVWNYVEMKIEIYNPNNYDVPVNFRCEKIPVSQERFTVKSGIFVSLPIGGPLPTTDPGRPHNEGTGTCTVSTARLSPIVVHTTLIEIIREARDVSDTQPTFATDGVIRSVGYKVHPTIPLHLKPRD